MWFCVSFEGNIVEPKGIFKNILFKRNKITSEIFIMVTNWLVLLHFIPIATNLKNQKKIVKGHLFIYQGLNQNSTRLLILISKAEHPPSKAPHFTHSTVLRKLERSLLTGLNQYYGCSFIFFKIMLCLVLIHSWQQCWSENPWRECK